MEADAPAPLAFTLEPRELEGYLRAYSRAAFPGRRYLPIGMGILCFCQSVNAYAQWDRPAHHGGLAFALALGAAACAIVALVLGSDRLGIALRVRRAPKRIAVDFEPAGIGLTRDDDFQRVSWYAIKDAFDLSTAIALTRRDDSANPIIVPKRAVGDDGALLWAYLERRLTGSRPSIRDLGVKAPTRIVNSIDQFASDRSRIHASTPPAMPPEAS